MAQDEKDGIDRRGALECMIWAGTGVLWTMAGGVPRSSSLLGISQAKAQAASGFTFLQISDSHIGFKAPANPNPLGTLDEAIAKVGALPRKPAFMIHTGDITHLSKPEEFDNADQARGEAYLARYGKRVQAKGTGWYSFDQNGVHFVGLVNVADLKSGGMGALGDEQLAWLADDLKAKTASTPIVLFAHIPFWTVSAEWGWGTEDSVQALGLVKRFGSVTVLNGHIHQIMQKVEGTVTFHTARSTAFLQPAPGTAPSPGPMKVPDDKLRSVLGITDVQFVRRNHSLAVVNSSLAGEIVTAG